jgi:hypothetical protein
MLSCASLKHRSYYAATRITTTKANTINKRAGLFPRLAAPSKPPSFGSVLVEVAVILVQLSEPQLHPLGQQSPPRLTAQLVHPVAQLAEAVVVAAPVNATTIVTPELTIVVEAAEGQLVVAQSLPVRQHPPA